MASIKNEHNTELARPLTIVLCGGGTAGHIMPPIAVARELKSRLPTCSIVYIIERNSKFGRLVDEEPTIDLKKEIFSGKFRRYHGESWLRRITDLKTLLRNIRDVFFVMLGIGQSLLVLKRTKPDFVFIKGGFVGVPVGLAAAVLKIPYITHDSDSVPGLANRLIGRWASAHAVGMPVESYSYPKNKTFFIGIPLRDVYQPVTEELRKKARAKLDIPPSANLVLVTGGSHGAVRLNHAFAAGVEKLLDELPDLFIEHQTGKGKQVNKYYEQLSADKRRRVRVHEFVGNLEDYSAAADVVVARAGATTIAEFASQRLACIFVPNPQLTNGHQTKNARILEQAHAAIVVSEDNIKANPNCLTDEVLELIKDDSRREQLKKNIQKFARPDATMELTDLLLRYIKSAN